MCSVQHIKMQQLPAIIKPQNKSSSTTAVSSTFIIYLCCCCGAESVRIKSHFFYSFLHSPLFQLSFVCTIYIYIYYMQKRHVAMSHSCYRMYSLAYTLLGHWLRIISLSICTCLISLMQVTITTLCIYLKMHSTIETIR